MGAIQLSDQKPFSGSTKAKDVNSPLKFCRVGEPGQKMPVVISDNRAFSLAALTSDTDGAFLEGGGIAATRRAIAGGDLDLIDITAQRLGPPIARPQALWCVGLNYADHARESGAPVPQSPVLFLKTPNTIIGPCDDVEIPDNCHKVDWEAEIALVIGRRAHRLRTPEAAAEHIAGYSLSNDVSERAWQLEKSGGQWSKGKCFPTFNPLGPYLIASGDIDVSAVRIYSEVNGEIRQDSTSADMIFKPAYLVWYLSQITTLEPGDVISTGTPQGVALSGRFSYLKAGDTMTVGVAGLGSAMQRCVSAPAIAD